MHRNLFLTALRHLRRQTGYTAVTVVGLAAGIATCLFIALYVRDHLRYDRFHDPSLHETVELLVVVPKPDVVLRGTAHVGIPGPANPTSTILIAYIGLLGLAVPDVQRRPRPDALSARVHRHQ